MNSFESSPIAVDWWVFLFIMGHFVVVFGVLVVVLFHKNPNACIPPPKSPPLSSPPSCAHRLCGRLVTDRAGKLVTPGYGAWAGEGAGT